MTQITVEVTMTIPGPDAPGFLRRQKAAMTFSQLLADKTARMDPEAVDEMVTFLLPFVEHPEDRKAASEALWDMSENQFNDAMKAVQGDIDVEEDEEIVPEVSGGN